MLVNGYAVAPARTGILELISSADKFKRLWLAAVWLVVAACLLKISPADAGEAELAVVDYQFVSSMRVDRGDYAFTYGITISNSGAAVLNVVATASSSTPNTTITDAVVEVGNIGAGASVVSKNTFTFRQNRHFVFDPASITWSFTFDVDPGNTPPVADAGMDQSVVSGTTVTLDGSGSTDADGDPITYTWSFLTVPPGSLAVLDDPTSVMPSFFADQPSDYVAQLVVNDGVDDSAPDTVTVSTANTPPVADAGLDQTVVVGATVFLSGAGSSDGNGDDLTYLWALTTRPAGSSAVLSTTTQVDTSFVADVSGTYLAELVVNDGFDDSAPDTVSISTENSPPVADAGPDQTVESGMTVPLNGTGSFDVDGDTLSYSWSLITAPPGSATTIDAPGAETTQFVPDLDGMYVAQLIVNDGFADSDPDTALITVVVGNQAPTAVATADPITVAPGNTVQLDGSTSSDPEDDPLTYLWSLSTPSGSSTMLSSTAAVSPTFIPDIEGTYVATLIVNDSEFDSTPAMVSVSASDTNNPPRLAIIGNRVMFLGETLNFRIFATDPDAGDTLTLSLPVQPTGIGFNPLTGDISFAPTVGQLGINNVTARVDDDGGLFDLQPFTIEVREQIILPPVNNPPTLNPIANQNIVAGNTLSLQTVANDPDAGDTLMYTLPASPTGMSISATGLITYTAVEAQIGQHNVTVKVTDLAGAAALRSFVVTVVSINRPPIAADEVYPARIGETTTESAPGVLGNDSDPDGDAITAALVTDVSQGVLDLHPDGSFDYTPGLPDETGPVELELQCEFASSFPDSGYQTNGTVTVGDVDDDGVVEIVGTWFNTSALVTELWVMNAEDCSVELATSPDVVAAGGFSDGPHLGLLDIDGDGDLEIIGPRARLPASEGGFFDSQHLIAVHHDGTLAWPGNGGSASLASLPVPDASSSAGPFRYSGPTFADLDADDDIEIIMAYDFFETGVGIIGGIAAYNSVDGTLDWEFTGGDRKEAGLYKPPTVVDLDRDGTMEVISHTSVVDHDGVLEFILPAVPSAGTTLASHLHIGVANFDGDQFPEIIARDESFHYLFEHDGTLSWQLDAANTSQSQITVADFDADGELEFAYNTSFGNFTATTPGFMVVYDTDGTILWSHESDLTLQISSTVRARGQNATAFDANKDGAADIVIHYDFGAVPESGVYIFDGRDGSLLEFVGIFAAGNAGDRQRFVTIVDVDDDGEAEIISSYNAGGTSQTRVWQGSSENPLPPAPAMRDQWQFNAAHLDDRRQEIISNPIPHWLQPRLNGHNIISTPDRVYSQLKCEVTGGAFDRYDSATLAVGDVDNDGDIEIVGSSFISTTLNNELWLLNADDCTPQIVPNFQEMLDAGGFTAGSHLGLLDIDGDSDLEIIGIRNVVPGVNVDGDHLLAIHHDGSLVTQWSGDGVGVSETIALDNMIGNSSAGGFSQMGPTFADIDANGSVEIIMPWYTSGAGAGTITDGMTVFNSADGSIAWEFTGDLQFGDSDYKPPLIADIDLDGTMEIIYKTYVIDHTGTLEFLLPVNPSLNFPTHLATAVANFDDDPYAEIIAIDQDNHYLFNHDGSVIFEIPRTNNSGSQIAVADFDGDHEVEYAWYNGLGSTLTLGYFEVYDTDGSVLWSHQGLRQYGEELTRFKGVNPTAFDANNDGAFDLVVHLDVFDGNFDNDGVYIFDGRDGSELEYMPIRSTSNEQRFTTIADVDNDGEAEIISSFTSGIAFATRIWEGATSHPLPAAPAFRNQWIFQEAYVNDDLRFPANPIPHWLQPGLNGYNLIKLPPDPLAGTTDSFTYAANDGALDSNVATVTFDVQPPGNAPVFLSQPDMLTTVGFPYEYDPFVVDVDPGDSISFTLATAPVGMTMTLNGTLNWLPGVEGAFPVSIIASDTIGFSTIQSFTLLVGQPVVVPDIVGLPQASAETTLTGANLLTGTVQTSTHPTIPAGSVTSQAPIAGAVAEFGGDVDIIVSLGPAPEDIDDDNDGFTENEGDCDDNDDTVAPGQPDPAGDGIDQDCDGIDGNLVLTEIRVSPPSVTVLTSQVVNLTATGIFEDGTSQNLTGIVNWSDGPAFSSATAGSFTVTATLNTRTGGKGVASRFGQPNLRTPAGLRGAVVEGQANIDVITRVSGDTLPPVATITAPENNSAATEPVDVTGSATDSNFLKYELAYAVAGGLRYTTITISTTPVTNGVLGQFDSTLLVNDLYTIRLTVFDTGGNQTIAKTMVQVAGDMKIGNFNVSFTDLQIPLAGIPITLSRTYDSRDKQVGDFGVGWRLGLQTLRLRTNRVPGTAWTVIDAGISFGLIPNDAHKISLTLPEGRVEEFDLIVTPEVSPIVPFPPSALRASYRPRPNTRGTLTILDNTALTIIDQQPGEVTLRDDLSGNIYDPDRFLYTTADGTEITLSKSDGVEGVRDSNGNTLTFNENGIIHSAGSSIDYVRDDLGRITSVVDPAGNAQSYTYDGNGDLRSHVDRENNTTRYDYNLNHGLIEIRDPLGRGYARNDYDASGRLVSVTDAQGNVFTFNHDVDARVEAIAGPNGTRTVIYDARGNVLTEIDESGAATSRTYAADDQLLSETNATGGTTAWSYDDSGEILSLTSSRGDVRAYTRDDDGRITQKTEEDGTVLNFAYDSSGNLISETDGLGNTATYAYDNRGLLIASTDKNGATTQNEYDGLGNLIRRVDATGAESLATYNAIGSLLSLSVRTAAGDLLTESRSYDANGRLLTITDANGGTTTLTRDPLGNISETLDPLGNPIQRDHDVLSRPTTTTFADGTQETISYGVAGAVANVEDRSGRSFSYTYDQTRRPVEFVLPDITPDPADNPRYEMTYTDLGLLESLSRGGGFNTQLQYDSGGRLVGSTDTAVGASTPVYDVKGRQIAKTDALGRTTTLSYDNADRVVARTFADGAVETSTYDAAGNLLTMTATDGAETRFEYDSANRLSASTLPDGARTAYQYDLRGNLVSQTEANGSTTRFTYDSLNRRTSVIRPLGQAAFFEYNAFGNLTRYSNFAGQVTEFRYNNLNQLTEREYPDGSTVTFTYTPTGKRASFADTRGQTDYSYNALDRLTRVAYPDGEWIEYEYDVAGNVTTIRTPSQSVQYVVDGGMRNTTITDGDGGTYSMTYNVVGNLTETVRPDGSREVRQYDQRDRLTRIENRSSSDSIISSFDYSYLVDGNVDTITESGGRTVEFEYDINDRLTSETVTGGVAGNRVTQYSYDAVGNRLQRIDSADGTTDYSYDANGMLLQEVTSGQVTSYAYDANGNMVFKSSPSGTTDYDWSTDSRLLGVSMPGQSLVQYYYDPEGVRLVRSTDGIETRFITDINREVSQVAEESVVAGTRIPVVLAADRPLSRGDGIDRTQYLFDGFDSVRSIADNSGNIDATYEYDAFGNVVALNGSPGSSEVQYRSERFDAATESYYLRARHYDPMTGRFLSVDPLDGDIRIPTSLHRYLYANSNPVAFSDPLGELSVPEVIVSIGIYGGLAASFQSVAGVILRQFGDDVVWTGPSGSFSIDPALLGVAPPGIGVIGGSLYKGTANCTGVTRDVIWLSVFSGVGGGSPIGIALGDATMYSPGVFGKNPIALTGGTFVAGFALGYPLGFIPGLDNLTLSGSLWTSGFGSNLADFDRSGAAGLGGATYGENTVADASASLVTGFTVPIYWNSYRECGPDPE